MLTELSVTELPVTEMVTEQSLMIVFHIDEWNQSIRQTSQ